MKSIQQLIPRSRVNLSYHTMVEGQLREVELPFRVIVLADLSHGSSTDRELDMETRRLRNLDGKNIDELMANMKITVSLKAKNFIDPEVEQLSVEVPIKDRKSFHPAEVANAVPQIRALLLLRKLLLEMQAQEVRNLMQQVFANKEELAQLRKELEPYAGYRLPARKELAPASAPVT